MSTCNFRTMNDFPLVCGGMFSEYADLCKEQYEEDEDEDILDFAEEHMEEINDEILFDAQVYEHDAEKFSDDLQYYTVSIEDGYYDGWQFYVTPNYDLDEDALNENSWLDNEDAHYYFDKCRSKVLREAKSERRKINKWLDLMSQGELMHKLNCVGVFSNGEAVYEEVKG